MLIHRTNSTASRKLYYLHRCYDNQNHLLPWMRTMLGRHGSSCTKNVDVGPFTVDSASPRRRSRYTVVKAYIANAFILNRLKIWTIPKYRDYSEYSEHWIRFDTAPVHWFIHVTRHTSSSQRNTRHRATAEQKQKNKNKRSSWRSPFDEVAPDCVWELSSPFRYSLSLSYQQRQLFDGVVSSQDTV